MNMEHEVQTGAHHAPGRLANQADDMVCNPELHLRPAEPKAVSDKSALISHKW